MKKKLFAFGLIAVMAIAMLAGCGKKDPIIGTWELTEASMSGITVNVDQLRSMGKKMSMEFKEDGKVVLKMTGSDDLKATWKNDGDGKYTLTDSTKAKMPLKLKDDVMTCDYQGMSLKFEKSDK